jgi:hypothetical protein
LIIKAAAAASSSSSSSCHRRACVMMMMKLVEKFSLATQKKKASKQPGRICFHVLHISVTKSIFPFAPLTKSLSL